MITKEQILKFIKVRNESSFNSNLQFQIDAEDCGINVDDLDNSIKIGDNKYKWEFKFGTMIEENGKLRLEEKQ